MNDQIGELIKDDLWHNPLQYFLVPDINVYPDDDDEENSDVDEKIENEEDEDEESAAEGTQK